jgi:BT4734-like, N-terminal domain
MANTNQNLMKHHEVAQLIEAGAPMASPYQPTPNLPSTALSPGHTEAKDPIPPALAKVPVSMFSNARGVTPTEVALGAILQAIRNGRYGEQVSGLRQLLPHNRAAYDLEKKKLPAFTVSGSMKGRTELVQHSDLLQVDLDKLGDKLPELRTRLKNDPHVAFGFLSPSGEGIKLGVAIDGSRHAEGFLAAQAYFRSTYGVEIDPRCKDVVRLCFVSYDPELWTNGAAVPLPLPEKGRVAPHSSEPCVLDGYAPAPLDNSIPDSMNNCLLYNTPEMVLRNVIFRNRALAALERQQPGLGRRYQRLVEGRFEPKSGERNGFITQAVPFLYHAVAEPLVVLLVGCFYEANRALWKDSYEQHMKETQAMLETTALTYAASLPPAECMIYNALPEQERAAFRICRDFALRSDPKEGRLRFFMSCNELGDRLGGYPMQAFRILRVFKSLGLIRLLRKGTQQAPGRKGEAGVYKWLLPDPGGAVAPPSSADTKVEAPLGEEVGR